MDLSPLGMIVGALWAYLAWRHDRRRAQRVETQVAIRKPARPVVEKTRTRVPNGVASRPNQRADQCPTANLDLDALAALRSLGFAKSTAVAMLVGSASSDCRSSEDRIMAALRTTATPPTPARRVS